MAIAKQTTTVATAQPIWRALFSKIGVFGLFFIIVGALVLLNSSTHAANTASLFGFGEQIDGRLAVPTQISTLLIGTLYVISGVIALSGQLGTSALQRPGRWLLIMCGVLIVPLVLIIAGAGHPTGVNIVVVLSISVRAATPVILGAMAGIWCERSGVTNVGIEGTMLTGACFGFITFVLLTPSLGMGNAQVLGVLVAVLAGGVISLLHAWLCITFKTDQIVSGTVINILAVGITSFVRREALLAADAGRGTIQQVPMPEFLSQMPIFGPILFQGRPIFYMMILVVIATHVMLYYTRWGLRMRAVGENPHAADTLGINVRRTRWICVFVGGLIAGLAGAWFSLETSGTFDDLMTNGRGFIAMAVMIFGNWTPFGAAAGGLLYGFTDNLNVTFQGLNVPVPSQFVQMVPYFITMVVLAGLVGRATAPKAIGQPYEKEGK
jgi:general nucleoside transport system permease protein